MTFGSLFAGIGGIDLGLERAGMECKWQVEYDDYCNKVLEKHWPGVKRYGDIREIDKSELEQVDLICGGFPCQPVSTAGKRKGAKDERWMWPEFYRIICETRPRWVLVENVRGILSIDSAEQFKIILRSLAEAGYDAEWDVLSSCEFGAPHTRERVFIVAYPTGSRREGWGETTPASPLLEFSRRRKEYRWERSVEPRPFGVAYGVQDRIQRLRVTGNAVDPLMAEYLGNLITEAHTGAVP